jgi:hypothetical protein
MPLAPCTRLGSYDIVAPIGVGGMARCIAPGTQGRITPHLSASGE